MKLSAQATVYKKAESLLDSLNGFFESDDQVLDGNFWWSLEGLTKEWDQRGSDIPEALRTMHLRRAFIQMQDAIYEYDNQDNPWPSADLLKAISFVLTTIVGWVKSYSNSMQPTPIDDLVRSGNDYATIAKKYNLVNPATKMGVAKMAEEEHRNPGTYIAPEWKHPLEIERLHNRGIVDELIEELRGAPDEKVELPAVNSSDDVERFAALYEDVDPEEIIEQAKSMGIVVRSNMKRETIIGKMYAAVQSSGSDSEGEADE